MVINEVKIEDNCTYRLKTDALPSNINLAVPKLNWFLSYQETRLKVALEDIRNNYDFIMIDCPPSLGLLTVNALTAADTILVPTMRILCS